MKNIYKLAVLSVSIILIGAGCSSATPISPQTNNITPAPVVQDQTPTPVAPAPAPKPTPAPTSAPTPSGITMAEVQLANNEQKCWSVVNGKVYDLTSYLNQHPGGKEKILNICGKDGTSIFNAVHGGKSSPEQALAGLEIGNLAK